MTRRSREGDRWRHHLRDEADAAFLYRVLSEMERDPERRDIYRSLAEVEDGHVAALRDLVAAGGSDSPVPQPSLRARFLVWLARRFGPRTVSAILLREEGREVKTYLRLSRDAERGEARDVAARLARESAEHAALLGGAASPEPWHRAESGGFLRNVVYGFNDGLTANFGLVAGLIGASVDVRLVILAGMAGAIADSLSMASSGYLAAKSEREVFEHEIALERREIALMPELEREELALIYRAKGIDAGRAAAMADAVMADPGQALEEKVREELGIGDVRRTPLREAWDTGWSTLFGALVPVLPFFVLAGSVAIWGSIVVAMLSHFAVGAARAVFTGRSAWRSGLEMFAVGLGVAIAAYAVGRLLEPSGVHP